MPWDKSGIQSNPPSKSMRPECASGEKSADVGVAFEAVLRANLKTFQVLSYFSSTVGECWKELWRYYSCKNFLIRMVLWGLSYDHETDGEQVMWGKVEKNF